MNTIKKIALSCLASLPIATVSFAAVSKLTELEGMKANEFFKNKPTVEPIIETEDPNELAAESHVLTSREVLNPEYRKARDMLLPRLTMTTTWQEAKERFKQKNPAMSGLEIEEEFYKVVDMLRAKGLLETDEKKIISKVESGHQP